MCNPNMQAESILNLDEPEAIIDAELEDAFAILYAKGFTPEEYYAAYKWYEREIERDEVD